MGRLVGGGWLDYHKEVQLHLLYSWNAGLTLYNYDILFTDVTNATLNMNNRKKKIIEDRNKTIVKLVYLTSDGNNFL